MFLRQGRLARRVESLLQAGKKNDAHLVLSREAPHSSLTHPTLIALAISGSPDPLATYASLPPSSQHHLSAYRAAIRAAVDLLSSSPSVLSALPSHSDHTPYGAHASHQASPLVDLAEAMVDKSRIWDAESLSILGSAANLLSSSEAERVADLVADALFLYRLKIQPDALASLASALPEFVDSLPDSLPPASVPSPDQITPVLDALLASGSPSSGCRSLAALLESPLGESLREGEAGEGIRLAFEYALHVEAADFDAADSVEKQILASPAPPSPHALDVAMRSLSSHGFVERGLDLLHTVLEKIPSSDLAGAYQPPLRTLLSMCISYTHEPGLDAALRALHRMGVGLSASVTGALVRDAARISPIWGHTVLDKLNAASSYPALIHVVSAYARGGAPSRALSLVEDALPVLKTRSLKLYTCIIEAYARDEHWDQLDALLEDDQHLGANSPVRAGNPGGPAAVAAKAALSVGAMGPARKYYDIFVACSDAQTPLRLEMYALGIRLAAASSDMDLCLSILDTLSAHSRYPNEALAASALSAPPSLSDLHAVVDKLAHPKLPPSPVLDATIDATIAELGGSPRDHAYVYGTLWPNMYPLQDAI